MAEHLDILDAILIDGLCDRFEKALRDGQPSPWDGVLADVPATIRWPLVRELIALEQNLAAPKPGIQTYIARFPDDAQAIRSLFAEGSHPTEPTVAPVDASEGYAERYADGSISPPAGAAEGPSSFRVGALLGGRYRLDAALGQGGMGQVFLATDNRLDRQVAVKGLLCRPLTAPGERARWEQRFLQEVRLAASLQHPSIASVFDYGIHRGQPYAVFAYLPGATLAELLARRGRLSLEDVRLIVGPLAQALDVAHQHQVVHRDLKPANVKALPSGQFAILDFGLARKLDQDQPGGFSGTPAYAAPEQALGLPTDGRADQYALALIAYELLSGSRPFVADSPEEYLRQHAEAPAIPISQFMGGLPLAVGRALATALEKDPGRRFESCTAFATALGCTLLTDAPAQSDLVRLSGVRIPVRAFRLELTTVRGAVGLSPEHLYLEVQGRVEALPHGALERARRSGRDLFLDYRLKTEGRTRRRLRFDSAADAQSWRESLEQRRKAASSPGDAQFTPIVKLKRLPTARYLITGGVEAFVDDVRGGESQLRLLAAVKKAHAIADAQVTRSEGYDRDSWLVQAKLLRAADAAGQQQLLAQWFQEELKRACHFVLFILFVFGAFLAFLFFWNSVRAPQDRAQALPPDYKWLAWAAPLVGFGWPLSITLALRVLRWPQLVTPAVLAWKGQFLYPSWVMVVVGGIGFVVSVLFLKGVDALVYLSGLYVVLALIFLGVAGVISVLSARVKAAQVLFRQASVESRRPRGLRVASGWGAYGISAVYLTTMLVCGILAMIDRVGAPFLELPLKGYERLEREALDDYNSVRLSRSNSEARDTLREKVLPKWRKARASLESNGWLLFDRARVDNLRRYMDLREEGFLLLLEAVERGDKELADRANAKQNQAEALLGELQQRK